MRVSLTARYVSHPLIDFGSRRSARRGRWLTPSYPTTGYHRPRRSHGLVPTVGSLRSQTSRFRFASLPRVGRSRARRSSLPLGQPRARRG
jgi:hypothetical protein